MTDIRVAAEQARVALEEVTGLLDMVLGVSGGYPKGANGPAVKARAALASLEAALAAQPEQQQGQGLVHPAMSTSGRTSGDAAPNAPSAVGSGFSSDDVEAVIACLGDDAAQLREENDEDERAANMDRAASMLLAMHRAAITGWTSVNDGVPEAGTECLVVVANGILGPYISTDCWDEQREAPVGFSTVTVPTDFGWGSYGFDEVSHWMPAPALPPVARPVDNSGASGSPARTDDGQMDNKGIPSHD